MPSSGSGIGTPIVGTPVAPAYSILPEGFQLGLNLDRYQEIMNLPPAAFNGLYKNDEESCFECAAIWTLSDRQMLAEVLAEAEEMREQELGYHVAPKYIDDEEHDYDQPLTLKRKHLIAVGSLATSTIEANVGLNLGVETSPNDPVEITISTTVTDPDEICVFHSGQDVKINPQSVVISNGQATIRIPRSRLTSLDLDTNCDPAPSYYENDNFIDEVDVKRCYTDVEDGAFWIWFGNPCNQFCLTTLSETTQLLYSKIRDHRLSVLELFPASYSDGTWTFTRLSGRRKPEYIKVSYLSGIRTSMHTELLTAALAHTLLPDLIPDRLSPCDICWKDDRKPDPSGLITPYGTATGAIKAWMKDSRAKVGQGGKFPSPTR